MSSPLGPENITVYRCGNGHTFFSRYDSCPECGGSLGADVQTADARLISHTVVRVNPTGDPYRLGIAEIDGGTKTLCIIEGDPPGAETAVRLHKRNELYYAIPPTSTKHQR